MIDRIYSLIVDCCSISVASLTFLRMRILSERNHLSIPDSTARVRKNASFVLGMTMHMVQPNNSPFSTHHLISVNYKVLSQFYQPISILFLYVDSARHNLVTELCRDQLFLFVVP